MLNKFLVLLFISAPLSLFSQIRNQEYKDFLDNGYAHSVPSIAVDSLKHLKGIYVLDTREKEEFEVSHLKNARSVGYIWFDMRNIYDIPKTATIVVYCSVGIRSEKIGEKLLKFGYKNVYNLYGGIFEWVNDGNPVYRSDGVQTSEIHTNNEKAAIWLTRGSKIN